MKTDPILQEVWDIKNRLAAEAGFDVDRFVDQLNEWTAKHPFAGPVVHNVGELGQRAAAGALALNENPPKATSS